MLKGGVNCSSLSKFNTYSEIVNLEVRYEENEGIKFRGLCLAVANI